MSNSTQFLLNAEPLIGSTCSEFTGNNHNESQICGKINAEEMQSAFNVVPTINHVIYQVNSCNTIENQFPCPFSCATSVLRSVFLVDSLL